MEETVRHAMTLVLTDLHGFVTRYKSLTAQGYSNVQFMAKLESTGFSSDPNIKCAVFLYMETSPPL